MKNRILKYTGVLIVILSTMLLNAKEPDKNVYSKFFSYVNNDKKNELYDLFHQDITITDVNRNIKGKKNIINWLDDGILGGQYKIIKIKDNTDSKAIFIINFNPKGLNSSFNVRYEFELQDNKIFNMNLRYANAEDELEDVSFNLFKAANNSNSNNLMECFTDDVVVKIVTMNFNGKKEILTFFKKDVWGGKYIIEKTLKKTYGEEVWLKFTPAGWKNPEPPILYKIYIKGNKIYLLHGEYRNE